VHERLDFTQTIRVIQTFRAKYPVDQRIFIESRANGVAAINTLSKQVAGINKNQSVEVEVSRNNQVTTVCPRELRRSQTGAEN
jgi:hypothetical protein